ncbi:hypothetical protein Tco_0646547 [Tanacetum coccineum]
MTTPIEKRNNNKFCEFHGEVRHHTDECMHLKRQIEELIKAGKMSHVIKKQKQGSEKDQQKTTKKGEASGKEKAMEILMVQPWQRVARQRITQSLSPDSEILFPSLGTKGPMIIEAEIRVRSPSPYNGIIGRPGVRQIQAVSSTALRMLKFQVPGGILTLRSSKIIPLECTMVSGPEAQPSASTRVTKEKIKVSIHPEYLEQTIAIAEHRLIIREGCSLVRQKKRSQAPERNKAIQEEVERLVEAGIMKEVYYHSWLNRLEGGIPLRIPLKILPNAYKGYHQIKMAKEDEEKAAFITIQEIFCYLKMPFGLKNAEATYQRLVDKAFQKQIGRNLEGNKHEAESQKVHRRGGRRHVPGIHGKHKRNKSMSDKVEAILSLPSPKCLKDVQKLNGKLASLNRFLAKSAEKSLPFFKTLKKCTKKRQILVDFIVERPEDDSLAAPMEVEEELPEPYTLLHDSGSFC